MPLHTIQDIEIEIDVDGLFDNKMVSQVISFPPPDYQFGYIRPEYTIAENFFRKGNCKTRN